jgi:hypothetical protein
LEMLPFPNEIDTDMLIRLREIVDSLSAVAAVSDDVPVELMNKLNALVRRAFQVSK